MQAAVFTEVGKPLTIERVPDPAPDSEELLVKVGASGICGTDLHLSQLDAGLPAGAIMGHEFAGEIVAVGKRARGDWRVGERIAAHRAQRANDRSRTRAKAQRGTPPPGRRSSNRRSRPSR